MSYTPPGLPLDVTWEGTQPYTPPDLPLEASWAPGNAVLGTFAVTIPAPIPPITFEGRERPAGSNFLWATINAPIPPVLWFHARERSIDATFAVTIPAPVPPVQSFAAALDYIHGVSANLSIPAPVPPITFEAFGEQNTDLPQDVDGPSVSAPSRHLSGKTASPGAAKWLEALRVRTPLGTPTQQARRTANRNSFPAYQAQRIRRPCRNAHGEAIRLQRGMGGKWYETQRTSRTIRERYTEAIRLRRGTGFPWFETGKLRNRLRWDEQEALRTANRLGTGFAHGLKTRTPLHQPWTHMIWPQPGRWWPFYVPPSLSLVIPCAGDYTPRPLECTVLLHWQPIEQPYCPGLDPEPPIDGPIIIPIREVYIVINTFALARADTAEPVPAAEFTATLDVDSWTWGWSARLPADQLALVRSPDPGEYVELVATLNGTPIRLAVERLGRDRRFGEAWLRISGRGRAAILGDPHSPVITRANEAQLTAQQLLEAALTDNGVPIGWTVDWQAPIWSVPAGVWAHTGTYIDAAIRLAEAAGGYVQAHDTAQTLHILPRYPVLPWNWGAATPDIVLPEDVCEIEGIEWLDRPRYNAVWISGAESGRRDRIRRTGSAADRYAPSIVDPLATHEDMTRARGSAILADTGRQAHISVRLPVLPETGIIKPGQLIQYTEGGNTHRGLSRSVSIEQNFPQLTQTVKIETHQEATP